MKRVLLVFGAEGMLGRDVVEVLGEEFDVVAMDIGDLDLTDMVRLRKIFRKHKPDLVVNAAAYTDVDGCEKEPEKAFLANAMAARNVAVQTERFGAELVHISTDYVFDGEKQEPYTEFDAVNPRGTYARSKHAGEEMVRTLCRRHYILRVSVLFGPRRKNFVDAVVDRARKGKDIQVPEGRVGCPTYTWDVAEAVSYLAGSERFGTFHFNQGEALSRLEFARRIMAADKLGGVKIEEKPESELGEVAPRPRHADLSIQQWRLEGFPSPRTLDEALEHYFGRKRDDGVTQDWRREGLTKKIEHAREFRKNRQEAWVARKDLDREQEESGSERPRPHRQSAYDDKGDRGRPPPRDSRDRGPRRDNRDRVPRRDDRDRGPRRDDRDRNDGPPPRGGARPYQRPNSPGRKPYVSARKPPGRGGPPKFQPRGRKPPRGPKPPPGRGGPPKSRD